MHSVEKFFIFIFGCLVGQTFLLKVAHILSDKSWSGGLSSCKVCIVNLSNKSVCSLLTKQVMQEVPTCCTVTTKNHLFSALQRCFSQLHLYLWQHSSLTPSPSAMLRMCTVSHPLSLHAHPALTIQPTVLHCRSMHKKLKCILLLTPL